MFPPSYSVLPLFILLLVLWSTAEAQDTSLDDIPGCTCPASLCYGQVHTRNDILLCQGMRLAHEVGEYANATTTPICELLLDATDDVVSVPWWGMAMTVGYGTCAEVAADQSSCNITYSQGPKSTSWEIHEPTVGDCTATSVSDTRPDGRIFDIEWQYRCTETAGLEFYLETFLVTNETYTIPRQQEEVCSGEPNGGVPLLTSADWVASTSVEPLRRRFMCTQFLGLDGDIFHVLIVNAGKEWCAPPRATNNTPSASPTTSAGSSWKGATLAGWLLAMCLLCFT